MRSQRQGSIGSNGSEVYSSKFARQYQQERSKSNNSVGSHEQFQNQQNFQVIEDETEGSKNGTKEEMMQFQDFYQNIEPNSKVVDRLSSERSDRKHYPKFQYVEPEQSETPKSSHVYHTKPDNSARGETSFLTNDVSYIGPQQY